MKPVILVTVILFALAHHADSECPPDQEECIYYFSIKEKLTMIHEKDLVHASNGKLYKYYDSPDDPNAKEVNASEVVTVDGYNRMAITVNETIPGPPIIVYEGQTVIVHVHNYLLSDSVTIHWHGLHQKTSPWMDGVGWVSQCPIASGQTFTYNFKAFPKGTFWYHSHVGAQRSNGLFGAFIIKEKPRPNVVLPEDKTLIIGDWHHESAEEVYVKMVFGNFIGREKYNTTNTLDGGHFSGVPWVSALINGKGRYFDPKTGKKIEAPREKITVEQGKKYRFRVIQAGTIYPLRVSVDNHSISVVASDGYDVTPVECESIIVNPGERYDFLLTADQPIGNYWIRTVSMEANVKNHNEEAILSYDGASDAEPTTTRQKCETTSRCIVINCPFKYFPEYYNMDCVLVSSLTSPDNSDPAPVFTEGDSEEHFLNFAFPGKNVTPGAINGRKFEFPGVNSLTQPDEIDNYDCDKHNCGHDKVCYCHYQLKIPHKKTIQMVWMNLGTGAGWAHPMHLHGHSFYVLKMGYPPQNATDGSLMNVTDKDNKLFNKDIDCRRDQNPGYEFCNEARWMNQSWNGGKIPGLNTKNPPRKDTLIIPTGAYAVLRIRSDNPGKWFLHCHIEVHALDGMAMIINEAPENHPKPPKGFPICQNFYNDHSRDYSYKREEVINDQCEDKNTLLIVCIVLAVVCFLLLIALIVGTLKNRVSPKKGSAIEMRR